LQWLQILRLTPPNEYTTKPSQLPQSGPYACRSFSSTAAKTRAGVMSRMHFVVGHFFKKQGLQGRAVLIMV